jgi:hypothetical protein
MVVGAALVLLVLVLASLAARSASWTTPAPVPTGTAVHPPAAPSSAVAGQPPTPPAVRSPERHGAPPLPALRLPTWVLVAVLVVLGAALLAWAVPHVRLGRWRLRRALRPDTRPGAELTAPDPRPLADAVDRALVEFEQPDVREAVIRSWLMLGEAAEHAGVPPRPAETSTEYAARIATEFYAPVPMLTRLAELYREARFSQHEVSGTHRAEARELLERLSTSLEHGRR